MVYRCGRTIVRGKFRFVATSSFAIVSTFGNSISVSESTFQFTTTTMLCPSTVFTSRRPTTITASCSSSWTVLSLSSSFVPLLTQPSYRQYRLCNHHHSYFFVNASHFFCRFMAWIVCSRTFDVLNPPDWNSFAIPRSPTSWNVANCSRASNTIANATIAFATPKCNLRCPFSIGAGWRSGISRFASIGASIHSYELRCFFRVTVKYGAQNSQFSTIIASLFCCGPGFSSYHVQGYL